MVRSVAVLVVLLAAGALFATGEPDISVRRGAVNIASGGWDNLGELPMNAAAGYTYTIDNLGTHTLNLASTDAVSVTGMSGCTVTITAQPASLAVAPAGYTDFTIEVTPTVDGAFGFMLSIASDDADENPYTIAVIGDGDDEDEEGEEDDDEDEDDDEGFDSSSSGCAAQIGGLPFALIMLGLAAFRRRN